MKEKKTQIYKVVGDWPEKVTWHFPLVLAIFE